MATGTVHASDALVCNRCKSKLISGLNCINCDNVFHLSCARLSANVKFSDDRSFVICCNKERFCADSEFFDAMEDVSKFNKDTEIIIYSYIIKQKDALIQELYDKIEILTKQIQLLNKCTISVQSDVVDFLPNKKPQDVISTKKVSSIPDIKTDDLKRNVNNENKKMGDSQITKKVISSELLKIQTRNKCDEIINLTKPVTTKSGKPVDSDTKADESSSDVNDNKPRKSRLLRTKTIPTELSRVQTQDGLDKVTFPTSTRPVAGNSIEAVSEENDPSVDKAVISAVDVGGDKTWRKVSRKRSRTKSVIVGNNSNTDIKSVPKFVFLHVSRLDKDTTTGDLMGLLKSSFPEVQVEKITSRYPEAYGSFKVGVYTNNFQRIMVPQLWPVGSCISKFFWNRNRINSLVK